MRRIDLDHKELLEDSTLPKQTITYHLLKESLIHQEFKPGSVLSERELCSHLGVSRPPVHNAVVQLVSEGLLVMEHPKRILVPQATSEDLHEIYEMLEFLQTAAIRSQNLCSGENLKNFQSSLDCMANNIDNPSTSIFDRYQTDCRFHALIMRNVENNRLRDSFNKYTSQYATYSSIMFHPKNWREHELHTHQNIYESLKNGMLSDFSRCLHAHYAEAFSNYLILANES